MKHKNVILIRFVIISIGAAIGLFSGYLFSESFLNHIRRTATSDEDITQAAFLCITIIFPLSLIIGGIIGNFLYIRYLG